MGGLAASLAELERLLAESEDPLAELARLAEPARLEHLFQVRLAGLVRLGPGGAADPHDLLATAQRAAAAGVLRRSLKAQMSLPYCHSARLAPMSSTWVRVWSTCCRRI